MNQVSWRRILQRAGGELPAEDSGAAVIKMHERAPERRGPAPAPARPAPEMGRGDLEAELKRALDRAQRPQRDARPAAPPPRPAGPSRPAAYPRPDVHSRPDTHARPDVHARSDVHSRPEAPPAWDPIFVADELPAKRAPVAPRTRSLVAPPQAPAASKRGGNGARNVIAISLSVAVIGLAIQQIGSQWAQSRGPTTAEGPEGTPEFNAATAVLHSGGAPAKAERRARLEPESEAAAPAPSTAKPSTAIEPQSPPERDAFYQEMEEASKILQAKQQAAQLAKQQAKPQGAQPAKQQAERVAALPVRSTPDSTGGKATISGSEEQSMLRRGRDLIQRGHVNGARMIFEHLASQQSALGAFALAQTYDASFLAGLPVTGLQPDSSMAAQWYQRAAEMSSGAASR